MGNIVAFFSADNKVGCTMISQAIANILSKKGKTVLYIHMDGNPGTEYIENHQFGLDDIRIQLLSDVITIDDIKSICHKRDNLYSIKGSVNYTERKKITPEQGAKLLELVKVEFDVVILDAGYSDCGLSIASIENSNLNFLVTTQQNTAFEKFKRYKTQVLNEFDFKFEWLIINKFSYSMAAFLPTENEIADNYGFSKEKTIKVPNSSYAWQAELEKATLLEYKEKNVIKSINDIANLISGELWEDNTKSKENVSKGKFLLKRKGK